LSILKTWRCASITVLNRSSKIWSLRTLTLKKVHSNISFNLEWKLRCRCLSGWSRLRSKEWILSLESQSKSHRILSPRTTSTAVLVSPTKAVQANVPLIKFLRHLPSITLQPDVTQSGPKNQSSMLFLKLKTLSTVTQMKYALGKMQLTERFICNKLLVKNQ
jgi:hypothetical protein